MLKLKELRNENSLSLRQLAEELGISYSSLSKYEHGDQQPSFDTLIKIADYFNVTTDYLIGYSNIKTKDIELRSISEKTGLSLRSLDTLFSYQKNASRKPEDAFDTTPAAANIFLETLNKLLNPFCDVLENISHYLYLNLEYFYDDDCYNDERYYKHISELGLFDKQLGISFCEDYDYLSSAFLLMIQKELMSMRDETQHHLPARITPIATGSDTTIRYSENSELFTDILSLYAGVKFSFYIDNAIKQKKKVNYADEYPYHKLIDATLSDTMLSLFFEKEITKSISLKNYVIKQSNSVPNEFYITNINPNGDYFIIIFLE